jgi:hypothetical protein
VSTATVDVLDADWDPEAWWSTSNMGDRLPGTTGAGSRA